MAESSGYLCERCRKFFPLSQVRYVPKGKDSKVALCNSCMSELRAGTPMLKAAPKSKPAPKKKAYICSRCSYRFRFDPRGVTNLKCPYCGRADRVSALRE